jgi:urease accessory protein
VLRHAYAEPPLRISRSFDVKDDAGAAYLILVCTGPGVFRGDQLRHRVVVGPGARVALASQSALQVHPADTPRPAVVHHEYHVAEDAELHCHWDPVVPFAGACLVQRFDLDVAPGSRLYWTDALMSGRASRGESWQFESVDLELLFLVARSLKYLERYRLAPGHRKPQREWMAGTGHYLGTAIVHHKQANELVAEEAQRQLNGIDGVTAGVDVLEPGLLVARVVAERGPGFARARTDFRALMLSHVFRRPGLSMRR